MTAHVQLPGFWRLYQAIRRHQAHTADDLGFGWSRTDTGATEPAIVPDGVDLYFFTGRTRREATR